MNVTCDACKTLFNVDDSRIPSEGIKVRCSKCQQVFLVRREVSEDFLSELQDFEKSLMDQMEKALADTTEDQPAPTSEEPAGLSFEEFMSKEEPGPEPEPTNFAGEEPVPGGFEQLVEPTQESAPTAEAPTETAVGEPAPVSEEPADISFEEFMGKEELGSEPVAAEEPTVGEVERFERPPNGEVGSEEADLQLPPASEPADVILATTEEKPTEDEEPGLSAEAFLKEEMARESEGQAREAALPSLKQKKFEDLMRGKGPEKASVKWRSSFRVVLFLILLMIVGAVAYLWWQNQRVSVTLLTHIGSTLGRAVEKASGLWEDVIGFRKEDLELSDLQGSEDMIGQHRVYIIKGNVTNKSTRVRKYVKLKVVILDQAGNRIKETTVFCGNVFTREELEKLAPRFFTGDETLPPKRPKDTIVGANETISFMAIFSGLPREGRSFKVEKLEAPGV